MKVLKFKYCVHLWISRKDVKLYFTSKRKYNKFESRWRDVAFSHWKKYGNESEWLCVIDFYKTIIRSPKYFYIEVDNIKYTDYYEELRA